MNTRDDMTPFDRAFAHNLEVRPCSFDPSANFETVQDENGNVRKFLGLPYKLLWFHSYCANKQVKGYVQADDYNIIPYETTGFALVTAKAKVIIDGEVVATASSGKCFSLTDPFSMDGAIQAATGNALSRALSNAGFGAISAQDVEPVPPGAANPPGALPFTFPKEMQGNNDAGAVPSAVPGNSNQQQTSLFEFSAQNGAPTSGPAPDPVAEAKMQVWKGTGPYQNKTLGELLAVSPKQILFIAETWKGSGPVKEAAKLLLAEAKKRCGK